MLQSLQRTVFGERGHFFLQFFGGLDLAKEIIVELDLGLFQVLVILSKLLFLEARVLDVRLVLFFDPLNQVVEVEYLLIQYPAVGLVQLNEIGLN